MFKVFRLSRIMQRIRPERDGIRQSENVKGIHICHLTRTQTPKLSSVLVLHANHVIAICYNHYPNKATHLLSYFSIATFNFSDKASGLQSPYSP